MRIVFLSTLLFVFACSAPGLRKPADDNDFIEGGVFSHLPAGTIVEGSLAGGGLQPNYLIDSDHPDIQSLIRIATFLGENPDLDFWGKVDTVTQLIAFETFKDKDYYDPAYLDLIKRYRESGKDIPLSEYVMCNVGVCREHALLANILLNAAGIENHHVYAKIARGQGPQQIVEDHAFNVVRFEDKLWVVDTYYLGFNGHLLSEILDEDGVDPDGPRAPLSTPEIGEFRRVVELHSYPRIRLPHKRDCLRSLDELM